MTFKEFLPIFAELEAAFGAQNEVRRDVYFKDFQGVDAATYRQAADVCRRTCRFFPTIAELTASLPGAHTAKESAKLAWLAACDAATDGPFSDYDPVNGTFPTGEDLDDAAFRAVGGVSGLCNLQAIANNPTALSFAERDFCDRYDAVAATMTDATHMLNAGTERRQIPAASHEPRQIGDITARMFDERPRSQSTVHYDRSIEPGTIPEPKAARIPEGSQIVYPETTQHDDSADPWGGVRNILRKRMHPLIFQLVMSHLQFDGVNESRRRFMLKVDPVTWQTLTSGGDERRSYRADIERAVAEWTGTTTWTVDWALVVGDA